MEGTFVVDLTVAESHELAGSFDLAGKNPSCHLRADPDGFRRYIQPPIPHRIFRFE